MRKAKVAKDGTTRGRPKGSKTDPSKLKNYGGRPKGQPNKITANIREAYKQLIEMNLGNMTKWLEKVAEEDPKGALIILEKLSVYVIPKLQSQELKIKENNINIDFSKLSDEEINDILKIEKKLNVDNK